MARIRIGIIGAGGRGVHSFARSFSKDHADETEVVALADPNLVRAQAGIEWLGIKADIHDNAEDLVKRKDIDAVVVTSPDYLHGEHAALAFKHKKHVFVDKPLATTVEDCLNAIEASKRARKVLFMGFNLRHHCVVRRLKELVSKGTFGDIFSVQAIEHYNGGRTYHSRWNRLKKYSGGLWIHKGSHDFDVINYLMGNVRPARVSCFAGVFTFKPERLPFKPRRGVEPGPTCNKCVYNRECPDAFMFREDGSSAVYKMFGDEAAAVDGYHKNLCMYLSDKDTHDQGIAIVEYENGATASHSEYFATPISNRYYWIEGTRGHGEGHLHDRWVKVYPRWSHDVIHHEIHPEAGGHGGADPGLFQTFVDSIKRRKRPTASGVDGTWSVAVAVAAEKSRAEKRVVEISELLDPRSKVLQ